MSGQELYRMHRAAWAKQNTEVEAWVDLHDDDQKVWEDMAAEIRAMYGV